MSVWCDCTNCGGTKEPAFCENAMLDMQRDVWRSESRYHRWMIVSIVIVFCGCCAAFFI